MASTYFQNHLVTITYDETWQLGIATWNGFLRSSEFRYAVEACLNLMDEHKVLRWLGDNRKMRSIRKTDQDWFVEYAIPRMVAAPYAAMLLLFRKTYSTRWLWSRYVKRAHNLGDMVFKDFDNPMAAMEWLKEPIAS
jgi:hypothetical protein